uniref:Translocating chain-associated membrane protein n=1 Tax=Ciona savignyi TaxID=51511 RepID=H2ZCV4_CIOSA
MGMPRKKPKSPPIMSHEFVIQNHADILACIAILIVLGLVAEITAKVSRVFVFLQHGFIKNEEGELEPAVGKDAFPIEFTRGYLDIFTVLFQAMMLIVVHAVIQEYIVDKVSKKLHLSKTKNSRFSESGQLLVWCIVAVGWSAHLIIKNGFFSNISALWEDYPHTIIHWETKLYLLVQMAYWVHMYPELYFQKARKEEIPTRVRYYTLHLVFLAGAYALNFWRVSLIMGMLHFTAEAVFHASRLLYFAEKNELAEMGFTIWRFVFPIVRLLILAIGFLTFWLGLGRAEIQEVDFATGNFNSPFVRIVCLASLFVLKVWLMWPYTQLIVRRRNEQEELKKKAAVLSTANPSLSARNRKKTARLNPPMVLVGSQEN